MSDFRVGGMPMVRKVVGSALVASSGARAVGERDRKVLLLDQVCRMDTGRQGYGAEDRVTTGGANGRNFVSGGHGGMEGSEIAHHGFVLFLFVGMDGLCMLTEVVETRKLLGAVASKGTFARMFSV